MNEDRKFGLRVNDINKINSIFESNPKIHKAILFGSRAKGNFEAGSDIDIALKGSALNLDDILSSFSEIEKLSLPYKVDIVIFERINEEALIDHITRVGVILFDRNNH